MKREHIIQSTSNPLIDFLQAHGCSFYSPLSANDTTDWISGNAMQKYANDSVVWDSNLNMWMFTYVSGQPNANNGYYAKWNLGSPISSGSIQHFCAIVEVYSYDSPTYTPNTILNYDLLPNRMGLAMYANQNMLSQCCQTLDSSGTVTKQYQYTNGVQNLTYTYTSKNTMQYEDAIRIGVPNSNVARKRFAMRNFAFFFGNILTKSEIDEYFTLI